MQVVSTKKQNSCSVNGVEGSNKLKHILRFVQHVKETSASLLPAAGCWNGRGGELESTRLASEFGPMDHL